jgi:ligand-binding sensor domain-containing protein/signal transduction histidine kinase
MFPFANCWKLQLPFAIQEADQTAGSPEQGLVRLGMNVRFPCAHSGFANGQRQWMLALGFVIVCETLLAVATNTPSVGPKGYTLNSWQAEDGLPQMTPTAITQTRDGYLWVGTFNGLSRFDGVRFTSFTVKNTPEFLSDHIVHLFEDRAGTLWIGTSEGGLVKYSNGSFHAVPGPTDFSRVRVRSVCEDAKGKLWVGTSKGLCQVVDGRLQQATHELLIEREVVSVIRGLHDDLWIGTHRDIRRLSADGQVEKPIPATRNVRFWAMDASGQIWACFVEGNLGILRRGGERVGFMAAFKVDAVHLGRDQVLRMGALGGGLYKVALTSSNRFVTLATFQAGITALYQDRDDNLWLGLQAQGLWCLRKNPFVVIGIDQGLPKKPVTSICEDRESRIWAATFGARLHRWNGENFEPVATPGIPSQISSLLPDSEGKLWLGSYGGELARRLKTGDFQYEATFGHHSRTLFQDRDGGVWAGNFLDGLSYRSDGRSRRYTEQEGLSSEIIQAIAQDHTGDMWIGTTKGLNRIHDGEVKKFFREDGLAGENVCSLFVDSEGTLWIGSTGGGLSRWRAGRIESIGVEQGLINDGIEQIIQDDQGYLWLGSNAGLMRADLAQLNDCVSGHSSFVHCMVFRREKGTPPGFGTGDQPSCLKGSDGKLWFATAAGIVVIDPAGIKSDSEPPPVYVEELRADKNVYTLASTSKERIVVPAGTRRLEFRYTGLDFKAPEFVCFRHKLDGFDTEWVNSGTRREAVYTSIPPGEYRFRVSAVNNQGVSNEGNESGAVVAFLIEPFYWQTRTFQIAAPGLGFLAIGAAAWGFISRRHKSELEMIKRKHALERERARIAKDMHDGLGSSLVKISLLGEQVQSGLAEEAESGPGEADRVQGQVRKMTAAARQVVREMDEIVWAVNPKNDTLENFAGYLCGFAREHFSDTPVECHLDFPAELPAEILSAEVRHNLFLAVREALNNALKHAEAKHVWVRMETSPGRVALEVRDDGKGFSPGISEDRNGLRNMHERLHQIGGQMRLDSGSAGTQVHFTISLK